MIFKNKSVYRHPNGGETMELIDEKVIESEVISGRLVTKSGQIFSINNGIPDFTWPIILKKSDLDARISYDSLAEDYDKYNDFFLKTYNENENSLRTHITEKLKITPSSKVLDVGCGGGNSSEHIAKILSKEGELFLQELSPKFLNKAVEKLKNYSVPIEFSLGNACYLPFPNNYFDAAHHFGGLNTFSEIENFLSEITRVVKPGGKVVIGDEGMAPWLRNTTFGKILMNSNPLLKYQPPLEYLPVYAGNVNVEWIIKGAFYLIEFTVLKNEPAANYDLIIPSKRGGSHWSRYYGNLEGVSDEAKSLAIKAQEKSGKSMYEWLNETIKITAKTQLYKE